MSLRLLCHRAFALVFAAAFAYGISYYPLERTWLLPVLIAYAALLCWRPRCWLFALPALLPVLDLAPWTGWFFLEEIDLLLLLTAAFAYWTMGPAEQAAVLPPILRAGLLLLAAACLLGLYRGLQPLPAPDANAFNNYLSPYNALRVGKGWFWALLLLPPLRHAAGPALDGMRGYLFPGLLCGLAMVALADCWERAVFPGLLNFSSDYRTTAPFSAMHTGGAALDGYLALTCPFLASQTSRPAVALALLALASYAVLSTFSRGLFAAYLFSTGLLAAYWLRGAWRSRRVRWRRLGVIGAGAAALVYVLVGVFHASGYRGLAAALAWLGAAFLLSALPLPWRRLPTALLCAAAAGAGLAAFASVPDLTPPGPLKMPYLLFICAGGAYAIAIRPALPLPVGLGKRVSVPALTAFCCMLLALVWICWHWAGRAAMPAAAATLAAGTLLIALNHLPAQPYWTLNRYSVGAALASVIILSLIIPIAGGYYASERYGSSSTDLRERWQHWQHVLAMMNGEDAVAGLGLGRFPAQYYWHNPRGELPATLRYVDEGGNRYLQMTPAVYEAGYGETLRLLQRVRVAPATPYVLGLDVRHRSAEAYPFVRLCQRLLLYPQNCVDLPLRLGPPTPGWRHYQFAFDSGPLGDGNWWRRAPVQLEIGVEGAPQPIDIDNISLRDAASEHEAIRNGSFLDGNNYWFFSSDHHHLPWHIKNLALNVYFELGVFGLLVFGAIVLGALSALLARAWRGDHNAACYLAALSGFLIVGLFDSLLDVPRITLLFLLLLCASQLRPAPPSPPEQT